MSSCAATELVAFQQFGPTRAKPGPPLEAFAAPGYARLSFALGDDDLVEGITRLQKLFA